MMKWQEFKEQRKESKRMRALLNEEDRYLF